MSISHEESDNKVPGPLEGPLDPEIPLVGTEDTEGRPATMVEFWAWAYSDVLSNLTRATFGEFLVARALGTTDRPRIEWDGVDLHYIDRTGTTRRVEVKTSSALQAYPTAPGVVPSTPSFDVGLHRAWDPVTGTLGPVRTRTADVYVLSLYLGSAKDADTNLARRIAVLDVSHWQFHIVTSAKLDEKFGSQHTIGLHHLDDLAVPCSFAEIRTTVDRLLAVPPAPHLVFRAPNYNQAEWEIR